MSNKIRLDGFPAWEDLQCHGLAPSEERFQKGPVAVIECVENIPCNPCEAACPYGAIAVGEPITNLPRLDFEACVGCGKCIAQCSGLAIFVVDKTYAEGLASVSFPHEYSPLPGKGQEVTAVDRAGQPVCKAEVLRVLNPASNDHTPVVTVAVPVALADDVRGMQRVEREGPKIEAREAQKTSGDLQDDDVLVCRCEEISRGEIRRAIAEGAVTVSAVKRRTRAGMGLCQGRTCAKIISRMLKEQGAAADEPRPDTTRFPVKPVELDSFCSDEE